MSENDPFDPSQLPAALAKLMKDLSALDAKAGAALPSEESEMLSLIVNGVLNGENLAERHPAFYKKLIENPELRQAFLDALESVEAERSGREAALPEEAEVKLDFLRSVPAPPAVETLEGRNWRATWQRTLEQLETVFSPPDLAYRADGDLFEDPWFTLLRDEIAIEGVTYDVVLDCTLSTEKESSLAALLNLAVTPGKNSGLAAFPLRASLHWGDYQGSILVEEEGRVRFPDIPIAAVFNQADLQVRDGLRFTLEAAS